MEDKYGKFCYEGYKASCEGKTWDGKEMMPWELLSLVEVAHVFTVAKASGQQDETSLLANL